MSPSTTSGAGKLLPSTLYHVYQTYKRSTATIIDWLQSFDKPLPNHAHLASDPIGTTCLTVRQILERAQQASKKRKIPPRNVKDAFKVVLVNRSILIKYYDGLPTASGETKESTQRHKNFNDTLAQAYALLFPKSDSPKRKSKKKSVTTKTSSPTVADNSFEVLSTLIEKDPSFDESACGAWKDDMPAPSTKQSSIADDPIENTVEAHAFILELQSVDSIIKDLWGSAAAGNISIATAGWLTNLTQSLLRNWTLQLNSGLVPHENFLRRYRSKCMIPTVRDKDYTPVVLNDPVGLSALGDEDDFLEFTHGYGLIWPYWEILRFREQLKNGDRSLIDVERRKFENYFTLPLQDQKLKLDFVNSVTNLVASSRDLTVAAFNEMDETLANRRYGSDKKLIQSIFRNITQLPEWELHTAHQLKDLDFTRPLGPGSMQLDQEIPLFSDLKIDQMLNCETQTSFIVGAHLFLESCRSFLPNNAVVDPCKANNKIKVLSFANDVRRAVKRLLNLKNDETKFDTLSADKEEYLKETLLDPLDKITSDKSFDLYAQSPWVAGSLMSAIVTRSMIVSHNILNVGGFCISLFHLHNMLQQLGVRCPPMPLLDTLSDLLAPAVFIDANFRPTKDFLKMSELAQGKDFMRKTKDGDLVHVRRSSKGYSDVRIKSEKLSVIIGDSNVDRQDSMAKFLTQIAEKQQLAGKKGKFRPQDFQQYPLSEFILGAKDLVLHEFEGEFPLARVNYFAVVELVLDVWTEVALHVCKPCYAGIPDDMKTAFGITLVDLIDVNRVHAREGIRFSVMSMNRVDTRMKEGAKGWRQELRTYKGLTLMRDAMVKVCAGKKLEDYLWKNI